MRQHDHYPEGDDNDEAQGVANIITDLTQSASEDKETINSTFTTMITTIKVIQDKIKAIEKGTIRKKNNNNKRY